MYREIGEQFRLTEYHPGLPETITKLEVVEVPNDNNCKGCYLKGFCMSQSRFKEITGYCAKTFREDKKSVIFKKIEK